MNALFTLAMSLPVSVEAADNEVCVENVQIAPGAETAILQVIDCPDVQAWDIHSPVLYSASAVIEAEGEPVDDLRDRFGFRTVEGRRRDILFNGDPTIRSNGFFIFDDGVLQDDDKQWSVACYRNPTKYRDGIVYVHPSKWSFRRIVIARYRYDDIYSLRSVVEDAKTRKQIGAVIPSFYQFIYLSRKNEAFLRQKADKHLSSKECPEPSKIVAAFSQESGSGKIVDAETDRVLGYYDRGGIGAAAAFIALTSTFHTNTEYANYQVDWEFED